MNLKFAFAVLIGVSISGIEVNGLRCYVCGDEGEPPCNDFDLKKDSFAKECVPPVNQGCEKQTKGNNIIRRCSERHVDDCQAANGVEYCYCFNDLCNSNISKWPTDDEDLTEGSGIKTISTGTEKPLVVTKEKSRGSKTDLYCSLVFVPFVTIFYNK